MVSLSCSGDLGEVGWFGFVGEVKVGNSVSVVSLPMTMLEFFDNVVSFVGLVLLITFVFIYSSRNGS